MHHTIKYGLRYEPRTCPECGSGPSQLIVVTSGSYVSPTPRNPTPSVRDLGYDCASCGAELRYNDKEPSGE